MSWISQAANPKVKIQARPNMNMKSSGHIQQLAFNGDVSPSLVASSAFPSRNVSRQEAAVGNEDQILEMEPRSRQMSENDSRREEDEDRDGASARSERNII